MALVRQPIWLVELPGQCVGVLSAPCSAIRGMIRIIRCPEQALGATGRLRPRRPPAKAVEGRHHTRPWRPAWASRLRMKCTRQRWVAALRIRVTAPSAPCGLGDHQLDAAPPGRARPRRNSVQKVSASDAPIAMPSTSRRPWSLTASRRSPRPRRCARPRAPSDRSHPARDRATRPRAGAQGSPGSCRRSRRPGHLALGDARHPHGLNQVVDRAGRPPWM